MQDKELLEMYVKLVPFLAEVMGPGCEIIVHDTSDYSNSIIAVENSFSNREIGGPMTDLAVKVMEEGTYSDKDYLTNYKGSFDSGNCLSSTYFIKNNGRIIGMLCINKDVSEMTKFKKSFDHLAETYNLNSPEDTEISENLQPAVEDLMHNRISNIIAESGISPSRMSMEEKIQMVHRLDESGVMMIKGAVADIAEQLGISVPTVYRYLKK